MKLKKQLTTTSKKYSANGNPKKYVTVHTTGNTRNGATAQMHANLQSNGGARAASWHVQVDDEEAIQSFPFDYQLWHAGDGRGPGNMSSIGVEICENRDGDYVQSVKNGAAIVRKICLDEGIPFYNIKQHHEWSGKDCPKPIRAGKAGITWDDFITLVKQEDQDVETVDAPQKTDTRAYKGDSIVDYLNMTHQPSSFAARKKLAQSVGIANYKGTADQNTDLLRRLQGKNKPTGTNTPAKEQNAPATLKKGGKVQIKDSAKRYSRSTKTIGDVYKGKTYTVQQVGKDDALIKELYSWVKLKDLTTSTGSRSFKVGDVVTVKKSADRYATGQTIAGFVKGNTYKVKRVGEGKVLLSGINSWVKTSDVK